MTAIILITIAALILWGIVIYNFFIRDKNLIKEAWSGIDVQLKRRHNLIPNLVSAVQGYSKHEKTLLEDITKKRSEAVKVESLNDKAPAESDLSGMLKNLFIVAENYPDLKASDNFLNLQNQLTEIEDQIQYARRYYNGAVRNYNIRVESFPSNIIASIFNFNQESFFEISLATERSTPQVKL
ncbi:MAG: LemA family protein [Ignavibacteriota bacterium]|nr:MAG: LemA family protein [Chlorobiota bacterium]MBE7477823.1 LemA family protein [Ignavibacteriales bacterium]MCE7857170.1 LemA family protein [Ignavibacteria bacterium CHB3]QKJ97602.1 MAG: LemA family protein [Ignavibacteriota bacterium]GIK62060.1 MAG: membrane protein [Ignavibacteriota bacterium]